MDQLNGMVGKLRDNISKVIIGKGEIVELLIVALLSGGHVLLEDVPGSGKTMLAKTLAKSIDGKFTRIQMTPDLLPSDITGLNFFNMKESEFEFIEGPVFTNIMIADEINRATPKTQSGLLECMEEKQVTVDGKTYRLEEPFMVIATQNPLDTQGVFPLPEAQIDRFFMKLKMEYPSHEESMHILKTHLNEKVIESVEPVIHVSDILKARESVQQVELHQDLMDYIINLVEATRQHDRIVLGLSSRAALALAKGAQAMAAVRGRNYVMPDDIKAVAKAICMHRIVLVNSERIKKNALETIFEQIINQIPVPTEEV